MDQGTERAEEERSGERKRRTNSCPEETNWNSEQSLDVQTKSEMDFRKRETEHHDPLGENFVNDPLEREKDISKCSFLKGGGERHNRKEYLDTEMVFRENEKKRIENAFQNWWFERDVKIELMGRERKHQNKKWKERPSKMILWERTREHKN